MLEALAKANGVHLVFLDACRNNPLKDLNFALHTSGLARVGDAAGFLIAFATQPDNVAYDGGDKNVFDPGNGYRDEYKKIWGVK